MPDISVLLEGRIRRKLRVPNLCPVKELRQLVSTEFQIARDRLRLVAKDITLADNESPLLFAEKDSVLAFTAPRTSASDSGITKGTGEYLDAEEEDERFRLSAGASRWERYLAQILQQRLGLPDVILQLLFGIRLRTILGCLLWLCLCPVAARLHIGPIYVLVSIVTVIYMNLGTRRPGEQSAYSVFNEGIRALPGQLNADNIDDQLRRGQM